MINKEHREEREDDAHKSVRVDILYRHSQLTMIDRFEEFTRYCGDWYADNHFFTCDWDRYTTGQENRMYSKVEIKGTSIRIRPASECEESHIDKLESFRIYNCKTWDVVFAHELTMYMTPSNEYMRKVYSPKDENDEWEGDDLW